MLDMDLLMSENEYFYESLPDGICNAINRYDDRIECCNQDGYELLVKVFGPSFHEADLVNAKEKDYTAFAEAMKELFELDYFPLASDAKDIIEQAFKQWDV